MRVKSGSLMFWTAHNGHIGNDPKQLLKPACSGKTLAKCRKTLKNPFKKIKAASFLGCRLKTRVNTPKTRFL
jgi:hypothetical protein